MLLKQQKVGSILCTASETIFPAHHRRHPPGCGTQARAEPQTRAHRPESPMDATAAEEEGAARKQGNGSSLDVDDGGGEGGGIHVIVGPMFAGKTTALLARIQLELSAGRSAALVKSEKDIRYGLSAVVSHDGIHMPCWAVPRLQNFRAQIGEDEYVKLDVIGIDEAQFFDDLYTFCKAAADDEGKTIVVAGLDGDFLRNSFGSTLDLIPIADSVVKLASRCSLCGKAAFFTCRKTEERMTEVVGGADVYMPVCRQHYLKGLLAHNQI